MLAERDSDGSARVPMMPFEIGTRPRGFPTLLPNLLHCFDTASKVMDTSHAQSFGITTSLDGGLESQISNPPADASHLASSFQKARMSHVRRLSYLAYLFARPTVPEFASQAVDAQCFPRFDFRSRHEPTHLPMPRDRFHPLRLGGIAAL